MKKGKSLFFFLGLSMMLAACSNSHFEKEKQRVEKYRAESGIKEKEESGRQSDEQGKLYDSLEKPLDEVILENDLDSMEEVNSLEVEKKPKFKNETDFSKFVAKNLYDFYIGTLKPEDYYAFLIQYGSNDVIKSLPSQKDAVNILASIQNSYQKQNITGEGYTITKVELDRFKIEGTFYRKVLTTNGEEYFLTIIKKENDSWKYVEDSPSPPYINSQPDNEEHINNTEAENAEGVDETNENPEG